MMAAPVMAAVTYRYRRSPLGSAGSGATGNGRCFTRIFYASTRTRATVNAAESSTFLGAALGFQSIEIADHVRRNRGRPGFLLLGGLAFLEPYLDKLPGIQPIPAAVGAFVHFHPAFGAEVMALELHSRAPRAVALALWVHLNALVAIDIQQPLAGDFLLLIGALKFESIK